MANLTQKTVKAVKNTKVELTAEQKWAKQMAEITKKQEAEALAKKQAKAIADAQKKRPGVIKSIYNIINDSDKALTQSQILEQLVKDFPNRKESSMFNTIKAQIGSNKRPLRMENELKCIFDIQVSKAGVKSYSVALQSQK